MVSIFVIYLFIGCLAFVIVYFFDLNKMKQINPILGLAFPIAFILQVWATAGIWITGKENFRLPGFLPGLFTVFAIVFFGLMLYTLFFALPFNKTYIEMDTLNNVVDSGMYALCRHPGVIWFFFLYICLWLASGKMLMLWAGLLWTGLDVLHVYIQDRWQFPVMLSGYDVYIRNVPFLIPSVKSVKNCIRR